MAETTAPSTLDPQGSSMFADRFAWQHSYECLYTTASDGRVEPALATKYRKSEDGRAYTFTLRRGVRFHNGDRLTADDVVSSFTRLQKSPDGIDKEVFPMLKGVEKIDDGTVRFTLSSPDAGFLNSMANPLVWGCAIMNQHAVDATNPAVTMVGTGPWKQTDYRANSKLQLERNTDYWGTKASAPSLSVLYIPNVATQVANLQIGKIDLMFPDAASADAVKGHEGLTLHKAETDSTIFLQINNLRKPLDNTLVRRAIALAIDRRELADGAYHGSARPSGYIPSGPWAPKADELPQHQLDVERAKELLRKAGYPRGFSTTLMYISGYDPGTDNMMTLMQDQLARVGIKAKLLPKEPAAWSAQLTGPDYDLSWNAQSYYPNPLQYVLPAEGRQGETPKTLRKLITDARGADTQAAYHNKLVEISRYEAEQVYPTLTLLASNMYVAHRDGLDHVVVPPSQSRAFLAGVTKEVKR
ncbi:MULTISPECIES: ABC transporter substrate-binding protein [unclassified Streptomyces]|uniref:ABC transporter substrate-binding protein n=1 Tax=unclassified Streptomyces TaxID=2593676 RepID=UPI00130179A9|nr:ABC transporter substrate-binding protein [Streptomyces sp. TSRI0281]